MASNRVNNSIDLIKTTHLLGHKTMCSLWAQGELLLLVEVFWGLVYEGGGGGGGGVELEMDRWLMRCQQ